MSDKPAFLNAQDVKLWSLPDGTLVLRRQLEEGKAVKTVLNAPRRALPLSEPERFIVLSDEEGREVGIVQDVQELEPESRGVLQDALKRAYRLERITRVLQVEREPLSGQIRWRVEIADESSAELFAERQNDDSEEAAARVSRVQASTPADAAPNKDTVAKTGFEQQAETETTLLPRLDRVSLLHRALHPRRDKSEDVADEREAATEREFFISGQEDVQSARYPHIYIVDVDRNRYEILNCEALDLESRRAAERYF